MTAGWFRNSFDRRIAIAGLVLVLARLVVSPFAHAAEETDAIVRGEQIFKQQCIQCHGADGQGVKEFFPDPLIGDATIGEVAELISDTMPEEAPDACVAKDAVAVATYIHHDFYSEAAQVRRRPPRAALARLTADQLRQSLADVYSRVAGAPWTTTERGIEASYYNGRGWKKEDEKISRVDPTIDFDFGHDGPGEGIEAKAFHVHWSGSLKVDQTGRYEIIARSTCSFTMDFGARDRQLIDNHVQSEGKEEFRRTVFLVGGRCYPITVDMNQRARKTEQPPASISLPWISLGGVEEIIPTDQLLPSFYPAVFGLQAKLPPDDRSYGYERGNAVSRAWEESTTLAAIEFARLAADELYPEYLRKHKKDSDENRGKLKSFLKTLVEAAFRGPVDDPLADLYINRQVDQCLDDAEAIRQVMLITLKSPRFRRRPSR